MKNAEFQNKLKEGYAACFPYSQNNLRTFNELVHVLRMDKEVEDYDISIPPINKDSGWVCIPSVKECFIPLKYLNMNVKSVELNEEFLEEGDSSVPLKVELF